MQYFPLYFDLQKIPCIVIGGGNIALNKIHLLLRGNCNITVVAPEILPDIKILIKKHNIIYYEKKYDIYDLKNHKLVICAVDDKEISKQVYKDAKKQGIFINVVDKPHLCDFIFPALVDRSPMVISICSNSQAPTIARLLRTKIEILLPINFGNNMKLLSDMRNKIKETLNIKKRRIFYTKLWHSSFFSNIDSTQSKKYLEQKMLDVKKNIDIGQVYLVGAGAGAVDLLTIKAVNCLQKADIILYDYLVNKDILEYARREAKTIYVGKKNSLKDDKHIIQQKINNMMVLYANDGKVVVRLKGGDSFIFGRGGEEIDFLMKNNIICEVVPGITSAIACACYAKIPLTLRSISSTVVFTTVNHQTGRINPIYFKQKDQTLVLYMAAAIFHLTIKQLREYNLYDKLPIAVIEKCSLPKQKIYKTTLADYEKNVPNKISSPAIIIIGYVISF